MATEADLNKLAGITAPAKRQYTKTEEEQLWYAFKKELLKPFTTREKRVRAGLHVIQKLHVGDQVVWQSRCGARQREGHVVAVVPPSCHPMRMGFPRLGRRAYWRDHESYVVESEGRRWWPRVGTLKRKDIVSAQV